MECYARQAGAPHEWGRSRALASWINSSEWLRGGRRNHAGSLAIAGMSQAPASRIVLSIGFAIVLAITPAQIPVKTRRG
jgi:hypothetical protein